VQLPNSGVLAAAIGPGSRAPEKENDERPDEKEQQAPASEGGAPGA
jgi:hypothetical protein